MRIFKSLPVIALALAGGTSGAQLAVSTIPAARFGVTGGLNLTTFSGDGLGATADRKGFIGGAVLVTPFTQTFSTQLELLYAMKGMKSLGPSGGDYALFKLDYVEVPVMLRADAPISSAIKPFAFTGPSFDFKVSCGADAVGNGTPFSVNCGQITSGTGTFKPRTLDIGWVLGGGLGFDYHDRRIGLSARYEAGLRSIREGGSAKHRALSFMASVEAPLPRKTRRQ
jgi:hypothetical protein